jgi:hypothetical protein
MWDQNGTASLNENNEYSNTADFDPSEEEEVLRIGLEDSEAAEVEEAREETGFEQRYERLRRYVFSNPAHREINYKILKYCREPRALNDLEERVGEYPEYKSARQSQYFLITWLAQHEGLTELEIDENDNIVQPEQKEGLTEDEVDDLVADYAYETTDVGLALVDEMNPEHRLMELLEIVPEHYDTYIEVLEFLEEPRGFANVDSLLRGRDVLMVGRDSLDQPMQPSVFVDRLERAGGIFWDEGWMITPEGKELLETIRKRVQD